jgi:hypothetical protein
MMAMAEERGRSSWLRLCVEFKATGFEFDWLAGVAGGKLNF